MNPNYLDWKISPKIERYRVLGLGEIDPAYEGSFLIPVSTVFFDAGRFRNRRRRLHVMTRKFFNNRNSRGGIGPPQVVAAVTAIGRGGGLLPSTIDEARLLRRRLLSAVVSEPGHYETGLGRRRYCVRGEELPGTVLCNNSPLMTVNIRDATKWDGEEHAREVIGEIFADAVPDFAGYIFCNASRLDGVYAG